MEAPTSAHRPVPPPLPSPSGRRGRPPRAAFRPPDDTRRPGRGERIAWLLRSNRLLGDDQELAVAARFADALRLREVSGPASPAQVSRWETSAARVDFRIIRRYEHLLGLPPNGLVAMADMVHRRAPRGSGRDMLDRHVDPADPLVPERLGRLLERALADDTMDGLAWDELTAHLAAVPAAFLHPAAAWEVLAHRLLAEMVIADGLAWCQRHEALYRLLQHPRGAAPTIAACGAFAADPVHQLFAEPLSSLELAEHPDAFGKVLAQLVEPTSDRALTGALAAALGKVKRRHLRPEQLERLAVQVGEMAGRDHLPDEVRRLTPVLRRHLAAAATGQPPTGPGDAPLADADRQPGRWLVSRIAGSAESALRRTAPSSDLLLRQLVEDMLYHAEAGERLRAGFLIAATPYREPVAAAVAAELPRSVRTDAGTTVALLTALAALGGSSDRTVIERLVVAAAAGPAVNEAAARALGVIPGHSSEAFWQQALYGHLTALRRTGSGISATTLRRLVQALGVRQQSQLLGRLVGDTATPPAIRATARWWLELPPHLRTGSAS